MNVFANKILREYICRNIYAERLVFRIYKKFISTQQTEHKRPNKILPTDLNRYFIKKKKKDGKQVHEKIPQTINN